MVLENKIFSNYKKHRAKFNKPENPVLTRFSLNQPFFIVQYYLNKCFVTVSLL